MAAKELRVAAFGLVDDVPQFEIAQVYLTIAAQKLGHEPDARHAAQRVLAAERLEQHYASLTLPADIRASFEKIVNQILTSDQVAVLHARPLAPVQPPAPQPPAPQSPAPITVQPPAPITPTPIAPAPKSPAPIFVSPPAPAPKSPAPIKPQPVAPIVVPPSPQPDPKPIISHEAPKTPIELPPAAPRAEVEPPSVPSGPRITKPPNPNPAPPTPAPKPAPVPLPVPAPVPVAPAPAPAPAPPSPAPAPATPALSATEVSKRLAPADAALAKNDLLAARAIYRALIETPGLDHASAMRIAEGSYRARDFTTAIRAFERAGGFRKGEEPYHYYLAVSLYETGRYNAAKRELAAALPYIEVTPDIARYRIKIEGAIE